MNLGVVMEKVLKINNQKDLNKFYNRLFLYRSFLYNFVTFKLERDKYDINDLILALNIKNRRKRLEFIYDTACQEIDNYFANKNVCGFENNQCRVQRKLKNDKFNGCCRKCSFQCSGPCPTKNLACKLFYCSEVKSRYKIIKIEDLKVIKVLFWRQKILIKSDYFSSREEVIRDLYLNSYIIGVIRIGYRFVKKLFLGGKK